MGNITKMDTNKKWPAKGRPEARPFVDEAIVFTSLVFQYNFPPKLVMMVSSTDAHSHATRVQIEALEVSLEGNSFLLGADSARFGAPLST